MKQSTINYALAATARVACCTFLMGAVACKPKSGAVKAPPESSGNTVIEEPTVKEGKNNEFAVSNECAEEFNRVFVAKKNPDDQVKHTESTIECCQEYTDALGSLGGSCSQSGQQISK